MNGADLFERPSTADTGERNAHDYYETAPWMTESLLRHHPIGGTVLEPCAGDGAIARVLCRHGLTVVTNDIDDRHPTTLHLDALGAELWAHHNVAGAVDWVVTNPTFVDAFPILCRSWQLARVGVAFLLRKTFLEPTKDRGPWLNAHPPARMIGLPRHNFRGKGSDSCAADWYLWLRGECPRSLPPFVIDHTAKNHRS
jgi:hypothetical protein